MSVKYGLLGILAKQPQHGYELKRSFEQLTGGFWELNYGQIYQTLDRLESEGYVTHIVEQEENVPNKKVYEITEVGRGALAEWIDNPDPRPRPLRDELFIRLAVMTSGEVGPMFDLLGAHRRIYLAKISELTKAKADVKTEALAPSVPVPDALVEELLIDAALLHAEADMKWLEHCEMRLRAFARAKIY